MVILIRSYGNHSNRLFQNLHIEAFCLENDIPFFNATLSSMARLFSFRYRYVFAFFVKAVFPLACRLNLVRYYSFQDGEGKEQYRQQLLEGRDKLVFVDGWNFRDFPSVAHQADFLGMKYRVTKGSQRMLGLLEQMKNFDLVLGVHVRRRDYKTWRGGMYYYNDAVYRRMVEEFVRLHSGKKIFALYFSDETLSPLLLHNSVECAVSTNAYYIDYQLMGRCHFLIGPPSTFTAWASFLYHVPYLHLYRADQAFRLQDFSICNG